MMIKRPAKRIIVIGAWMRCAVANAQGGVGSEGLRDVKGPVDFPPNVLPWVIGGSIILVLAAYVVVKLRSSKKTVIIKEPEDSRLPWEIAYEAFDDLERSSLLDNGEFKTYYSHLSGIIREYFENRFAIHAPEMTTEEFLWSLDRSNHLTREQNLLLRDFLSSCDVVKFAKHIPGREEGQESLNFARKLVDETKQESRETQAIQDI